MDDPVKTFNQLKSIVTPFFNLAVNTVVHGMHNVPPSGKLIIVGNHRSDMDPFVISATFPRFISWVAADYTFRIPLFKDLISKTGCIPMAIDSKVSMSSIKMIQQVFKRGEVLGIFPEGHDYMVRNDFSLGMVDFHEGFSAFSIRNKVDITPFIITPIEETVSDIPIAPILRAFMGLPEEVCSIKKRVTYKKVLVSYGKKIDHKEYLDYPLEEGMKKIAKDTKQRMLELQEEAKQLARA